MEITRGGLTSAGKRKACEVDFDTLPQGSVEALIRKDVEHISSIFGVSVRRQIFLVDSVDIRILSDSSGRHCLIAIATYGVEQGTVNREVHGCPDGGQRKGWRNRCPSPTTFTATFWPSGQSSIQVVCTRGEAYNSPYRCC